MKLKLIILFTLFFIYCYLFEECLTERIRYLNTERPVVAYINEKYVRNVTLLSRRIARNNPRFYMSLYFDSLIPITNNIKVDFYYHEYVQINLYRRSFFELHFRVCDMLENDQLIGQTMKKHLINNSLNCPSPPGQYNFENFAVPFVPSYFPDTRGRMIANVTLEYKSENITLGHGYLDVEIKTMIKKKNN